MWFLVFLFLACSYIRQFLLVRQANVSCSLPFDLVRLHETCLELLSANLYPCVREWMLNWTALVSAEANPRDQGFPPNSKEEGCTICQDQEEQGYG